MNGLQSGQVLGAYRIISQIGQGGMATVYKAYHAAMDRYVAIKVLPRPLAESPEFAGRFRQEARTIANLEHAHILPVYDHGESDGVLYLVMRYLDSGTLKDHLASGPLSITEIDRLFSQLAGALEYAHARGVIHRDLKPSNALIDARGDLFLTDFGIAKLLESDARFTGSGAMVGTPAYMSPEQAQGRKIDQRTDIYSLGIILYEMITGRIPFDAETPLAIILKHINAPLPLPSVIKPDVSPSIERILLKALAKDPADRFSSVAEFLSAWKQALAEAEPERTAKTVSATLAPKPRMTRLRLGWVLGGIGALALIALGIFLWPGAALIPSVSWSTAAPTLQSTALPSSTDQPTTAPDASGWTSWTAANDIGTVVVYGDRIYTGGWGGVTVWNRKDGAVVERFTTANGLPHPYAADLVVDPQNGQLWVGTDGGGVAEYDGKEWTVYNKADGLATNGVLELAWVKQGLMVGTGSSGEGKGLNLLTAQGWQQVKGFPSADQPDKLYWNVHTIAEEKSGVLWAGTLHGLGRYDPATLAWKLFFTADGLPDDDIMALMVDANNQLWVMTAGGVARFNGERFEPVEQLRGVSVTSNSAMLQDSRGRYWFAWGSGGVVRFDPDKADWASFGSGDFPPSARVMSIAEGEDGKLYFGTSKGLVVYDGKTFATWSVPNVPAAERGFGHILLAPDGSLWFVGVRSPEADCFDLQTETWSPVTGLPRDCWPLAFDAKDNLWCNIYRGGLRVSGAGLAVTSLAAKQGLPSDLVTALAFAGDGAVWIGTDSGVAVFDGEQVTQVYNTSTGLPNNFVRVLFAAPDGSMWVSTGKEGQYDLSRLSAGGQWEHYGGGNPFVSDWCGAKGLAADASGALWVAASCDAIYKFADGQWSRYAPAGFPRGLGAITLAPDGSVWVGLTDQGAGHLDGETWRVFGIKEGLIHHQVHDIYIDPSGAVWFATEAGATRYRPLREKRE